MKYHLSSGLLLIFINATSDFYKYTSYFLVFLQVHTDKSLKHHTPFILLVFLADLFDVPLAQVANPSSLVQNIDVPLIYLY